MATDAANELDLTHTVDHEAEPADVVAALVAFCEAWLIEDEVSAESSKPR